MTVYEIPNIEHCNVRGVGDPVVGYTITANEGWYIHLNNGPEDTTKVWKGAVVLLTTYDFSLVEIRAEADLPDDAEICADVKPSQPVVD